MFNETQRQVRKQQSYEKSRVYDLINGFKAKNLNYQEILLHINIMTASANNTETQQEVLSKAKQLIETSIDQEIAYETKNSIYPNDNDSSKLFNS